MKSAAYMCLGGVVTFVATTVLMPGRERTLSPTGATAAPTGSTTTGSANYPQETP